jgi:hypothetical protein
MTRSLVHSSKYSPVSSISGQRVPIRIEPRIMRFIPYKGSNFVDCEKALDKCRTPCHPKKGIVVPC